MEIGILKGMKVVFVERVLNANYDLVRSIINNSDEILSLIPFQIERTHDALTLAIPKLLFIKDKIKFNLINKVSNYRMTSYTFLSDEGDELELMFMIKGENDKTLIHAAAKYDSEKARISEDILRKIVVDLVDQIEREVEFSKSTSKESIRNKDISSYLGKLSFLTRMLSNSKLIKSELVEVRKGEIFDVIHELVSNISESDDMYYISGTNENTTFRFIVHNHKVLGSYVNIEGEEYYNNENALFYIEGSFRVNVYKILFDKDILREYIHEST